MPGSGTKKKQPNFKYLKLTRLTDVCIVVLVLVVFVYQVMSEGEANSKLAGLGALSRRCLSESVENGTALNVSAMVAYAATCTPEEVLGCGVGGVLPTPLTKVFCYIVFFFVCVQDGVLNKSRNICPGAVLLQCCIIAGRNVDEFVVFIQM